MGSFRKISEDAVVAATGKGWGEWLRLLDEWGMKERGAYRNRCLAAQIIRSITMVGVGGNYSL